MKLRFLLPTATVLLISTLTSCTTTDPAFTALKAQALTSPSSDAIVGMWYRKTAAGAVQQRTTNSMLFSANGTGLTRASSDSGLSEVAWTWRYQGNGAWVVIGPDGSQSQCWTTGRELLIDNGYSYTVYIRPD